MENSKHSRAASHSVEHPVDNLNRAQTRGVTVEDDEECLRDGHTPVGEISTAKWNGVKASNTEVESLKEVCPPSDLDEDSPEELNGRQTWSNSMKYVKIKRAAIEPAERPQIKSIQNMRIKVKEEFGRLKETCGQQSQVTLQSHVVEQTLHKELTSLKQENSDLIQELRKEKDESRLLHNVTSRLCTAVAKETNMLQCLSKEMESISNELQQEHTWRLQLSDELQEYKNTLLIQIRAERSPNGTERNKVDALLKEKDHLTIELQKERNWKLQLSDELQEYTNVLLKKYQAGRSTDVTKARCQMLDSIQGEAFRISSTLMTELKKIESYSKQKSLTTTVLQREHKWKMPQSDFQAERSVGETGVLHQMFENLQNEVAKFSGLLEEEMKKKNKQNLTAMPRNNVMHQHVNYLLCEEQPACDTTQVESHKERNLKITNLLLNRQLHVQNGVIANLEAETVKLSHRLEMEVKKKKSLSKLRVSDIAQLEQEKEWRMDLIYQLEKQVSDHQQELEALHQSVAETQRLLQELEALKMSKSKLHSRLHLEEELCHHFQTLSLRLTANLQTEKRKNHSLTDVLQNQQSCPELRCHECQSKKETPQEVDGTNSRDKCAKQTRDFFTWRRNKTKRQTESSQ